MIKTDATFIQAAYQESEIEVDAERRQFLAHKGELLYGKYCGTKGKGICSESFVEYHIWRGEYVVAQDFLTFLYTQQKRLQPLAATDMDTAAQLAMTDQLIRRVEELLGETLALSFYSQGSASEQSAGGLSLLTESSETHR